MIYDIALSQLLGWIVSLSICVVGVIVALIRLLLWQFERRLDERFTQVERSTSELGQLDAEFHRFRAHVSEKYIQRDDYVRGQTVLEAKMDALYYRLAGAPAIDWSQPKPRKPEDKPSSKQEQQP